jgi:hypothetical protein
LQIEDLKPSWRIRQAETSSEYLKSTIPNPQFALLNIFGTDLAASFNQESFCWQGRVYLGGRSNFPCPAGCRKVDLRVPKSLEFSVWQGLAETG